MIANSAPAGQADPRGTPVPPPTVLYIAGSGRSGSTMVERALGAMPQAVNVGELMDLFWRTAAENERCGCGQPFTDCPFWTDVGSRAFGGWSADHLQAVHRLQRRIARQRHLPRLLTLAQAGPEFRAAVDRYGREYARLYTAIAAAAQARLIVDASKWPVQALALARGGLDVRIIHLVRDVRGVAYSLGKQDVTRPHAAAEGNLMFNKAPLSAAARWVACQTEAELLGRCGLVTARLRYEEFVRDPRPSIERALREIGLPPGPGDLAHITGEHIQLGPSHGLSGNPSRFLEGNVMLRPDEAWRDRMRARDRRLVTIIGSPYLLRYQWSGPGRDGGKSAVS